MTVPDMTIFEGFFPVSAMSDQAPPARALDAATLAALVEAHADTLYRVAYSVVRHPEDAEDVVQETYMRVLRHAGKFSEIRDPRVWLIRIAWNLSLDRTRRRKPISLENDATSLMTQVPAKDLPADASIISDQNCARILRLVDTLPLKEREVLLLSALQELSTVEIARILKTTESTIRSRLFRARQHLRARMDSLENELSPEPSPQPSPTTGPERQDAL
jgi:RNA polymerase sigma-70 factor, ECF subfamily